MWPLLLLGALGAAAALRRRDDPWSLAPWPFAPSGEVGEGARVALRLVHDVTREEATVTGMVVGLPTEAIPVYTVLLAKREPPPNPAGFETGHFVEAGREFLKVGG